MSSGRLILCKYSEGLTLSLGESLSSGRRLDEGEIRKVLILFSSPQPSPAGEGAT